MNNEKENLVKVFTRAIKESDFPSITKDGLEAIIDSEITNEILKAIPGLKILMAVFQSTKNVRESFEIDKMFRFLGDIGAIDPKTRTKMMDRLEKEEKYKKMTAEQMLLHLSRHDHIDKSSMLAKAIIAYNDEKVDSETLHRLAVAIDRIVLVDLPHLKRFCLEWNSQSSPFSPEIQQNFINSLLATSQSQTGGSLAYPTPLCRIFIEHILGEKLE